MKLVGVLLIVLGGAMIYLLGYEKLDPDVAVAHVRALFSAKPAATPAPAKK